MFLLTVMAHWITIPDVKDKRGHEEVIIFGEIEERWSKKKKRLKLCSRKGTGCQGRGVRGGSNEQKFKIKHLLIGSFTAMDLFTVRIISRFPLNNGLLTQGRY